MSKLWKWVNEKEMTESWKVRSFLLLNFMKYGLWGFFVWLIVSRFMLRTIDWGICFVGYPGFFIGFLGGYFFLCRKN